MPRRAASPAGLSAEDEAQWARRAAAAIWVRLAEIDYAGWDPYDALNSRLLASLFNASRPARRALTLAVKRSPLPLQPLLRVARQVDAYTLGHVLLAAARLHAGPPIDSHPASQTVASLGDLSSFCERALVRLRAMAHVDGGRLGWGYHFPVQTRFFFYEPPTPNVIVTAFVVKGLAAVARAGLADCSAEIQGAAAFILGGLPRVADETGQCIGYLPGETAVVHNANMLAALALCEAAECAGTESSLSQDAADNLDATVLGDEALACARFTAARQASDGSWPYSEEPYGRWVDGFHTGFVLEGLARVVRATGDDELRTALGRGVRFYVAQLFGPQGEPKYFPHRVYPLDVLSAAQGVETLHVATGANASRAVPRQLEWIRRHLVKSDGRVAYQVHRYWTDRREFPRWASAPLMSALSGVPRVTLPAEPFFSSSEAGEGADP